MALSVIGGRNGVTTAVRLGALCAKRRVPLVLHDPTHHEAVDVHRLESQVSRHLLQIRQDVRCVPPFLGDLADAFLFLQLGRRIHRMHCRVQTAKSDVVALLPGGLKKNSTGIRLRSR